MVPPTRNTESILYPYALAEDGKLVYIHDVERGKFTCLNPECKGEMVARQGDVNQWHFAHHNLSTSCSGETALHATAKRLLRDSFFNGTYPTIQWHCEFCDTDQVWGRGVCDDLILERRLGGARPDVSLLVGGSVQHIIEVVVAHDIEDSTLSTYKALGIPALIWRPTWEDLRERFSVITISTIYNRRSDQCIVCADRTVRSTTIQSSVLKTLHSKAALNESSVERFGFREWTEDRDGTPLYRGTATRLFALGRKLLTLGFRQTHHKRFLFMVQVGVYGVVFVDLGSTALSRVWDRHWAPMLYAKLEGDQWEQDVITSTITKMLATQGIPFNALY